MREFKVGDVVVRIGGDYREVRRGCQYKVAGLSAAGNLKLEGLESIYDSDFFELASVVPGNPQAFKADAGKPRFDLLTRGCPNALQGVVNVLTFAVKPVDQGGKGYVPHSWQNVPDAITRYESALHRHLNAINRGELVDSESGMSHWDHVATNALFLSELTKAAKNDPQESK